MRIEALDQFLQTSEDLSSSYCACLTVSPDDQKQLEMYAEDGKGFVIGFNIIKILESNVPAVKRGEPFIFCAPVNYDESDQRDLVWRLVNAGINDLKRFAENVSTLSEDNTGLRNRITQDIVVVLLSLINFIKAPCYSREKEFRLMFDLNDGTLFAPKLQYFQRNHESIPFIFMDFRDPSTNLIPLAEIKIGPKASFSNERGFLKELLKELGYGSNYVDESRITHSRHLTLQEFN